LFNEAIDQYRFGEEQMDREAPQPRHVELVYKLFDNSSTILPFMADYAAFKALKSKKQSGWINSGLKIPQFLTAVAARVDGKVPILAYNVGSGHWSGFKGALDNERGKYHVSNEPCVLQNQQNARFASISSLGPISNQRNVSAGGEITAHPPAPVYSTGGNLASKQNASSTKSPSSGPHCNSSSSKKMRLINIPPSQSPRQ
jgi:hypothetical protein